MQHNYRMTIAYDGSRYSGWQKQGNTENTIQGHIETVLAKLMKEEVEIHGSGRTDAGVHALEQVANFKIKQDITPETVQQYLNQYLPLDIRILSVSEAAPRFHARLNASHKHYRYQIDNHAVANIFERKYLTRFTDRDYFYKLASRQNRLLLHRLADTVNTAEIAGAVNLASTTSTAEIAGATNSVNSVTTINLANMTSTANNCHASRISSPCQISYDMDAMRRAAEQLMGEHDFKSFCDNRHMKKSTVRLLEQISITEKKDHILTLDFYGNGFLYHMVRILTGTLLEVGIGWKQPKEIKDILNTKNRNMAGFTAPPQGLFLVEVKYD